MMTAAEYREKAAAAQAVAAIAPDATTKKQWGETAKQWAGLAVQAELQAALLARLQGEGEAG